MYLDESSLKPRHTLSKVVHVVYGGMTRPPDAGEPLDNRAKATRLTENYFVHALLCVSAALTVTMGSEIPAMWAVCATALVLSIVLSVARAVILHVAGHSRPVEPKKQPKKSEAVAPALNQGVAEEAMRCTENYFVHALLCAQAALTVVVGHEIPGMSMACVAIFLSSIICSVGRVALLVLRAQ